jgi:tRNA threonylcarbamoyladenosine biosynthesis protein TsaB
VLLLAIDTSGPSGGITLAEAAENPFRVIESAPIAGGTFSAQLIPTVAALLNKHGFAAKDLGGFAAASGPGSFTGLRVGLSAIKGLAEVLHKPIAVVSVLEALAASSERQGSERGRKIAAALDAGRKEAFLGFYKIVDSATSMEREELAPQAELAEKFRSAGYDQLITSDPALAELASAANIAVQLVERPGSQAIARLGARKLLSGETISVEALDANYLRRSDAEIFFKGNR